MSLMSGSDREAVARAYNPVGWVWYDRAEPDHPAKPVFYDRELRQIDAAIGAYERLARIDFTITPEYWQAVFGAAYKPVRWGKHQAGHPVTVREVIAKLQAGESCPEAVDVIAGLVHGGACGWQIAGHLGNELLARQEGENGTGG